MAGYRPAPYAVDGNDVAACPACGLLNDADARYCDQCGAGMTPTKDYTIDGDETVACPVCGNMAEHDSKVCDQCGAQLAGRTDVEENSAPSLAYHRGGPPRDGLVRAISGCEVRDAPAGDASPGTLVGHLAVFNQWSEINSLHEGHFLERISPDAFNNTLTSNRAPKVTFNHGKDPQLGDKVLGIPSVLEPDDYGVRYEVPLFDTSYNRDLAPGLRAGAYGSSFRFNVLADDFNKRAKASEYNPKGLPERTVRDLVMPEFGPVTFPAYEGASAGMRSLTDRFHAYLPGVQAVTAPRAEEFLALIGG
jgi:HK97 family phage prohead protease